MIINDNELYTTSEVAEYLKVTPVYVTRICKSWELEAKRIGAEDSKRITWRILGKDVLNYISKK